MSNTPPRFMVDSIDLNVISNVWSKLDSNNVDPLSLIGITANPGIYSKVECNTIIDLLRRIDNIIDFINNIQGKPIIHVQCPSTEVDDVEFKKWMDIFIKMRCIFSHKNYLNPHK